MINNKRQTKSQKIHKARLEKFEARLKSRKRLFSFFIGCIVAFSLVKRN